MREIRTFVDKNRYKCVWMFDPIFCANIYVTVGISNAEEINLWIEDNFKIKNASSDSQFNARTVTIDHGMNVCIFFKSYKFDSTFCANLSHEAFHAAHMILSYRGQGNNDPDGEEVHAYFSSWIVKETLDGLKRLNKKKQIE